MLLSAAIAVSCAALLSAQVRRSRGILLVWVYSVGWGFLAKAAEESPETSWLRCLCETVPLNREFLECKIHGREILYAFLLFSPIQLAELMTQISHFHMKIMDLPPF